MAPVIRVKLGKIGAGLADYGIQIFSAAGTLMYGLSGAETAGLQDYTVGVGTSYTNDADVSITGSSSETEVGSISCPSNGGAIDVYGVLDASSIDTDGAHPLVIRIRKDSLSGTILDEARTRASTDHSVGLVATDGSPASTQVYKLSIVFVSGLPAAAATVKYRRFLGVTRKR